MQRCEEGDGKAVDDIAMTEDTVPGLEKTWWESIGSLKPWRTCLHTT